MWMSRRIVGGAAARRAAVLQRSRPYRTGAKRRFSSCYISTSTAHFVGESSVGAWPYPSAPRRLWNESGSMETRGSYFADREEDAARARIRRTRWRRRCAKKTFLAESLTIIQLLDQDGVIDHHHQESELSRPELQDWLQRSKEIRDSSGGRVL